MPTMPQRASTGLMCAALSEAPKKYASVRLVRAAPLLLLLLIALSSLPPLTSSAPAPCAASSPELLGFVRLTPGRDFPGNDLQYVASAPLADCLQQCLAHPGGQCVMVTSSPASSPAGECWLKSAVGPTEAANSAVQAFALPCNAPATCGQQLCRQTVGPTSVQCQCIPPEDSAYEPTVPFNSWFRSYDTTWRGTSIAADSASCAATCTMPAVSCALAVYNPGSRQCFLKYKFDPSSMVPDARLQAFVRTCSNANGGCLSGQACQTGPPTQCISVAALGFTQLNSNVDYEGINIISYPDMDSAECVQACAQQPQCMVAQIDPSIWQCRLKSAFGTPIASPGTVAYARVGANS